jgi:hypothetical protein
VIVALWLWLWLWLWLLLLMLLLPLMPLRLPFPQWQQGAVLLKIIIRKLFAHLFVRGTGCERATTTCCSFELATPIWRRSWSRANSLARPAWRAFKRFARPARLRQRPARPSHETTHANTAAAGPRRRATISRLTHDERFRSSPKRCQRAAKWPLLPPVAPNLAIVRSRRALSRFAQLIDAKAGRATCRRPANNNNNNRRESRALAVPAPAHNDNYKRAAARVVRFAAVRPAGQPRRAD